MKKLLLLFLFSFVSVQMMNAQNVETNTGQSKEEELQHTGLEVQVDSSLLGYDVFMSMPYNVEINQSDAIRDAVRAKIAANDSTDFNGFRIRIYLDSRRGARNESAAAIKRFNELYPYISADRSFDSPNFKVSVGNFRTRLEAENFLAIVKKNFPNAFIVRERFKYPSIGSPDLRQLTPSDSLGIL